MPESENTVKIQDAYTDWSTTYDKDHNRTRDLDEVITRKSLANLRCASILELGCGTAKNTAFLSTIGTSVHALDFSEGMISRAREKSPPRNVTFELADITHRWPCDDGSIDLIACNLVLEHIQNLSFIFGEAFRVLAADGMLFIAELHPFRQYQGTKANFQRNQQTSEIPAFVHHISEFTDEAGSHGLALKTIKEWWHEEDRDKPPRLVSLLFQK